MRAFESPWDLTTGHDDIFEVGFFLSKKRTETSDEFILAVKAELMGREQLTIAADSQKVVLQPHLWCIFTKQRWNKYWGQGEVQENAKQWRWMLLVPCFSNDNTWRTEKMRSCGTNMNKPLEDIRMLLGVKLLWLFCTWGKFDSQGACLAVLEWTMRSESGQAGKWQGGQYGAVGRSWN